MASYIYGGTYSNSGKNSGPAWIVGRVKDIVLQIGRDTKYTRKDLGKIFFEPMYSNTNLSLADSVSKPAYPIFTSIKQYPLIGEIVFIIPGPDSALNDSIDVQSYYYFPPYSTWNFVNHGAFPNLTEAALYYKASTGERTSRSVDRRSAKTRNMKPIPLGKTFEERTDIRSLMPFEGDIIVEGRFGQSIRFGSTVKNAADYPQNPWSTGSAANSPITIIRNGQGQRESINYQDLLLEDINLDPTSIWLTSNQYINIDNQDTYPLSTYDLFPNDIRKANEIVVANSIPTINAVESAAQQDLRSIQTSNNGSLNGSKSVVVTGQGTSMRENVAQAFAEQDAKSKALIQLNVQSQATVNLTSRTISKKFFKTDDDKFRCEIVIEFTILETKST